MGKIFVIMLWYCIRHSPLFDMQYDHVLKKLNFDLLTPSDQGVGGREGVCGQNICYHAPAFRDSL